MRQDNSKSRLPVIGSSSLLVAIVIGASIWWLMRPAVRLNENSYATTLALYRVCNQESVQGLKQIEAIVDAAGDSSSVPDPGLAAIESIIEQARQNQWRKATQDCRELLDSQVQR